MKLPDNPPKVVDEVMAGVLAIKRGISERHGHDIDRLLGSLMAQEATAQADGERIMTGKMPAPPSSL